MSPSPAAASTKQEIVPAQPQILAAGGDTAEMYSIIEKIAIMGDLSALQPADRVRYYAQLCYSLNLNPLTRPFEYISLSGKLTLYAKRDAAEQLRVQRHVSVDDVERQLDSATDLYHVRVRGHDGTGRTDEAEGIVAIKGLTGEALANAKMKAETKAKRRFTLSICGLGMLDATEIEDTPSAVVVTVDPETGEVTEYPTGLEAAKERTQARRQRVSARRRGQVPPTRPQVIEQPGQETAQGAVVDAAPAPASPPEAGPVLDAATGAVLEAVKAAGLEATWPAIDQLARDAMNLDPETMTAANWLTLRDRIVAGEFAAEKAVAS